MLWLTVGKLVVDEHIGMQISVLQDLMFWDTTHANKIKVISESVLKRKESSAWHGTACACVYDVPNC